MRIDLDVPVAFVEALLKQHLSTLFAPTGSPNGHAATNGHAPEPAAAQEEEPAPVLPSSTGAP
jgi:hypothetical protein